MARIAKLESRVRDLGTENAQVRAALGARLGEK